MAYEWFTTGFTHDLAINLPVFRDGFGRSSWVYVALRKGLASEKKKRGKWKITSILLDICS
jgi:hypothetical protein